MSKSNGSEIKQNIVTEPVDEMLPVGKLFTFGLQHVLAMYAGAVAIPLLVGVSLNFTELQISLLVAADLFTCGIATLIQSLGLGKQIGIRLPAILGCSFAVVAPLITIGGQYGMQYAYGAILCAGAIVFLASPLYGEVLRFFPPVVIGSVVTIIGLSLLPVAAENIGGGVGSENFGSLQNLLLASIVMVIIILFNRFFTGFLRSIAVLIGILVGTIAGSFMGIVDMTPVHTAHWFGFVRPFIFGAPKFAANPILLMVIIMLICMIESTGTYLGIGKVVGKEIDKKEIVKGMRAEGLATVIGGVFNSFSYTCFNQNLGLLTLSKVYSRFVGAAAGVILVLLGLCPKFAALATIIPNPVIGGATIVMFALVAVAGFNMLREVDFDNPGNTLIVACSIGIGLAVTTVPTLFEHTPMFIRTVFGGSGIVSCAFTAVILNILFHHIHLKPKKQGPDQSEAAEATPIKEKAVTGSK
ncbi:nucleobase:cation symporter-2 family protein [Clostridium minihomine]|uniref:nucleobase:cation symporter-2 family protein n=1 Tax=Clostridium minihomine TaxID=2045012 RepID=UPI000C7895F7|nr:nucleobase:cation symporter-2 family protein [Clostridium minihomine]